MNATKRALAKWAEYEGLAVDTEIKQIIADALSAGATDAQIRGTLLTVSSSVLSKIAPGGRPNFDAIKEVIKSAMTYRTPSGAWHGDRWYGSLTFAVQLESPGTADMARDVFYRSLAVVYSAIDEVAQWGKPSRIGVPTLDPVVTVSTFRSSVEFDVALVGPRKDDSNRVDDHTRLGSVFSDGEGAVWLVVPGGVSCVWVPGDVGGWPGAGAVVALDRAQAHGPLTLLRPASQKAEAEDQ